MCKYPAPECKPIEEENGEVENVTAEEDNAMSEDEDDEDSDSDSHYTESSVDLRSDSESDGESASGHRVTPDMVLLLMLKEHGAITEEKYAEKAEQCDIDFRSLIPTLPRSFSTDTIDYTKDLSEAENSDNDENNASNVSMELGVTENKGTVETSNINEFESDITNDKIDIAFIKSIHDLKENNACSINNDADTSKNRYKTSHENILEEHLRKITKQSETKEVKENLLHCQVFNANNKSNSHVNVETITVQEITRDCGKDVVAEGISTVSMKDDYESQKHVEDKEKLMTEEYIVENKSSNTKKQDVLLVQSKVSEEDSSEENLAPIEVNEIETNNFLSSNKTDQAESMKTEEESEKSKTINEIIENVKEANNNSSTKEDILIEPEEVTKKQKSPTDSDLPTGKITKSFKYIIKKLIRENRIPKEDEDDRISDEYGEDYGTHLLSLAGSLDRDYKNNEVKISDNESDNEDCNLREFAIYLNFYSPSSYKYILETYNTPLPELKVLYAWYLKENYDPGLSLKAFEILKEKSSVKSQTCSLMFIDVFLKNDGHSDQVDYGFGENMDFEDKAVMAYVFVLVSLDEDWKMPIGYILARNIPAETQAEYIRICLTHCYDAGVNVVAVTLETPTPAEYLGCSFDNPKDLKTTFKHPSCDRHVAIWIDPCLALKSTRQTLKVKGVLKDYEGNKVRWQLIRQLRRLHTDDSINFVTPEFFELRNHIAKIGLTSETFSKSLIPALELGEKLLPDMFTDTEPTKRYITAMHMLYSLLNNKITIPMHQIASYLDAGKKYLLRMFLNEENKLSRLDRENLAWKRMQGYRYFIKGEPACGFIGLLICIESFKHLYRTLVKTEKRINYINPQRLSKGQAENFVNNLRAYGWNPDRLTGECFRGFYEKLFNYLDKNPQFTDKNVPLEHWKLQDRFSPAVTIRLTSGKRSYDDVYSSQYRLKKMKKTEEEEKATKLVREYSKAMDSETDLSIRKNMVGFLSGWIAAKFAKCLKCEACIDSLCTNKKIWFHKYITLKRIYALCLPSKEIFKICWECEKTLRSEKGSPARLRSLILRRLAPRFPWSSHSKRRKHASAHHTYLVRAVIAKYLALRIATPFSGKDKGKIVDMFRRFTTKDPDGSLDKYRSEDLSDWLDGSTGESEFEY